jgi:hypothetical protein
MDLTHNKTPVDVNNIIINQEEYARFDTLEQMREYLSVRDDRGCWVKEGPVVYVRCPNGRPPFVFISRRYGVLEGFTDGKPLLRNGRMYRPGLLSAPKIEQKKR